MQNCKPMENMRVDLSKYRNVFSFRNLVVRVIWTIIWNIFARPFPRAVFNVWKLYLLRMFGAKIHKKAKVYSSAKIYMPWNLEMDEYSCLAADVDCYNVDKIKIGAHSTVSQKCFLCTASHNIKDSAHSLITAPIIIEDQAWIAADAFIGPGVKISQGAVVGARAAVFKNIEPWTIVGGNPAKYIKNRELTC